MEDRIGQLTEVLRQLAQPDESASEDSSVSYTWLTEIGDCELERLLAALVELTGAGDDGTRLPWTDILSPLIQRQRQSDSGLSGSQRRHIVQLHRQLTPAVEARWGLLQWLACSGQADDLQVLTERLIADPPMDVTQVAVALSPLFQQPGTQTESVFPRLLDALQFPAAAAVVLDLANLLTRQGLVEQHPAQLRKVALIRLLGETAGQLSRLEDRSPDPDSDLRQLNRQVDDGVALIVSLCDALAWIGDDQAVGKLFQVLELRHRRIRVEAASALARLNQPEGVNRLVEMAAEPVVRLRVLADARALGFLDQIDPEFTTAAAQAEAEAALMLSQPTYWGTPPSQLDLIDTRCMHWPGYERPVDCFLFRYSYDLAGGSYANVAIVGPVSHAITADLTELSLDDVYAVYAGWHAEHDTFCELVPQQWSEANRRQADSLRQQMANAGYAVGESCLLGHFFDQSVLVARGGQGGVRGLIVADGQIAQWHPDGTSHNRLGPSEVFWMYKGRNMLQLFNA